MLLTSMSEHGEANKVNKELKDSGDNDDNNQAILLNIIIPSDPNDIQPRAAHVWNCNEFGFDTNRDGPRSSVLTSSFEVKKCGNFKL